LSRQIVGLPYRLKYATPVSNAVSLFYGITRNHPFHNGNKRTGLVALLCHLDANKLCLFGIKDTQLFDWAISVTSEDVGGMPPSPTRPKGKRKRARKAKKPTSPQQSYRLEADAFLQIATDWMAQFACQPRKTEKQITFREMKSILRGFGFDLTPTSGNKAHLTRTVNKKGGLLRRSSVESEHIATVGWHSEGRPMSVRDIKHIRKLCKLDESHGVDSVSFYGKSRPVDEFINAHRKLLHRLAKT
jgi:death-on-curing protein